MNEETALTPVADGQVVDGSPGLSMAEAASLGREYFRATKLSRYQEGVRPETLRREKTDLVIFGQFLESIGVAPGDFFNDLYAWQDITGDLIETFIDWQKRQGYAIGSINVRLATVKAYCHLAFSAGKLDHSTHTHIQGVKGIPRKQARNIAARSQGSRVGHKKAQPVDIPLELLPALKHPDTGFLAKRDALLMCLLLDHGLRVGGTVILKRNKLALRSRRLTFFRPKVDEPQI